MVVILKNTSTEEQIGELLKWLGKFNVSTHFVEGTHQKIIGLIGDTTTIDIDDVAAKDCVESVRRVQEPYKNANRRFHPDNTVMDIGGRETGGGKLQVIAGPCSVETREQLITTAVAVKQAGDVGLVARIDGDFSAARLFCERQIHRLYDSGGLQRRCAY